MAKFVRVTELRGTLPNKTVFLNLDLVAKIEDYGGSADSQLKSRVFFLSEKAHKSSDSTMRSDSFMETPDQILSQA